MLKKSKWLIPAVCALCAAACGLIRGCELYHGFEFATELAIRGSGAVALMRAAMCVSLAVLAALTFVRKPAPADYDSRFAGRAIMSAGAVLIMLAAPFDWITTRAAGGTSPASRGIMMLFALIAGALCLISLAPYKNRENAKLRGAFSLGTVFLFCYALVIAYRDIAPQPSVESYVYRILGIAALILAFYYVSAHAFGAPRPRAALFFAAAACVLLAADVLGAAAEQFLYGEAPEDIGALGYCAAGMVWAFGAVTALCGVARERSDEPEADGESEDGSAEPRS